jgi:thiol:disulfide interchange protein
VRVLPPVERAIFDIPSGTFAIVLRPGADAQPVLAAIQALGYTPEIVGAPPAPAPGERMARLDEPTSPAVRDGLARARGRGVVLVVALGGPFCRLCRLFEETTLADERVLGALEAVEFLQVDVALDPAAARDFDVHAVPDFWLLDGEGRVLGRTNAALDADGFLAFLELAVD